jgi:glycosyltransferase involved in cell wall biosynthesis
MDQYGMSPPNAELQARYGLTGASVILTLARLSRKERYKGIDEVIETLPSLLTHYSNLKYMVCGDGDDIPRLKKKVHSLGLSDRVIFTGVLKESEKADHLRLADAFVMPGYGEGFGFVFLEALACGVPVVGSQLDGSREALRGGELGELANPNDPASVQVCILNALGKPLGIPPGLSYFDWAHFQHRLLAAVQQLLPPKIAQKINN